MATLKQRLNRKNSSGTYDTVHLETSSEVVKRPSGETVENDLTNYLPKVQNSDSVPQSLKSGQIVTGKTGLIYKGKDGTGRIIKPDEYALKSEVEGVVGDMNNELVKYGKEKISKAITEKGVPTSTSDSFDQMAANIGAIKSEYNNGDLNIFCQTTKPSAQNGLWIKRNPSEINNILIKDDYYLEDGVGIDLPINFNTEYYSKYYGNIVSGAYNNKLFTVVSDNSSNASKKSFKVDLNNNILSTSNLPAGMVVDQAASFQYKNFLYIASASSRYLIYNMDTETGAGSINLSTYDKPISACVVNNIAYIFIYNSDRKQHKIDAFYINDSTGAATSVDTSTWLVLNIPFNINYSTNFAKLVYYNGTIYSFCGMKLLFTVNVEDKTYRLINSDVSPIGYDSEQEFFGTGYSLGKVFFVGTTMQNVKDSVYTDICVYDISSNSASSIKNAFIDINNSRVVPPVKYHRKVGFVQDGLTFYIVGDISFTPSGSSYEYNYKDCVTKYSLQSNNYKTGTILCQPSATSNLTKMYSSGLITLNYGIDDVYYQAADGLHKQDAAIIKDGVVTDI